MSHEHEPKLIDDGWRDLDIAVLGLSYRLENMLKSSTWTDVALKERHLDTMGVLDDYQQDDHTDFGGLYMTNEDREAIQLAWGRWWATRESRESGKTDVPVIMPGDDHDAADV
jgi:hypothetical protein